MNDTQKSWANARQRFLDEWAVMTFYERFEQIVALILANVIAIVIMISLLQLIGAVVVLLAGEVYTLLEHSVFQGLFGMIMTLLCVTHVPPDTPLMEAFRHHQSISIAPAS